LSGKNNSFCSVAKTASHGTPESGNRSGVMEKYDQMKSYNPVASKLVYDQSTGPAFGNMEGVQAKDPAVENNAGAAAVAPTAIVQKGHSGSQSSDGPGDLDCDSNDLEGELVKFYIPLSALYFFFNSCLEKKYFCRTVEPLLNVCYSVR